MKGFFPDWLFSGPAPPWMLCFSAALSASIQPRVADPRHSKHGRKLQYLDRSAAMQPSLSRMSQASRGLWHFLVLRLVSVQHF